MKLEFNKKRLKNWLISLGIIVLGIVFDQVTKILAVNFLKGEPSVNIIGNFLRLTYVENTGMAFGLMKDDRWVFMTISTLAIGAMLVYLFLSKKMPTLYMISISIIASGGIGNMIDRVRLEYVIDFVDVKYFAVFNGADSLVCIGAGLLILAMILDIFKESKKQKSAKAEEEKEE